MPKISVILSCGNHRRSICGRYRSRSRRLRLRSALETPISYPLMVHHLVLYKLKPEVNRPSGGNDDEHADAAPQDPGGTEHQMRQADRAGNGLAIFYRDRF